MSLINRSIAVSKFFSSFFSFKLNFFPLVLMFFILIIL